MYTDNSKVAIYTEILNIRNLKNFEKKLKK